MKRNEAKVLRAHLEAILRELELMGIEPEEAGIPTKAIQEKAKCEPQYYTPKEVQRILKIGESTFYQWIRKGILSKGRYYGHNVRRWTKEELENVVIQ